MSGAQHARERPRPSRTRVRRGLSAPAWASVGRVLPRQDAVRGARSVVWARLALVVLVVTQTALAGDLGRAGVPRTLGLLAAVAVAGSLPVTARWLALAQPVSEAALGALVAAGAYAPAIVLPYLMAPALAAGLAGGTTIATFAVGAQTVVLTAIRLGRIGSTGSATYTSAASQWLLTALAMGLLGAWVRRIQLAQDHQAAAPYRAAYRLLAQLREVTRQLDDGLDPVTITEASLAELRSAVGYRRAEVHVRSPGGVLVPIAHDGPEVLPAPSETDPAVGHVLATGTAVALEHGLDGSPGATCLIPLRMAGRTFGVISLTDTPANPYGSARLTAATNIVDPLAVRLETALLFAEIRQLATSEERRRLAREIHDGIAQELASLGYLIDDMTAAVTADPEMAAGLRQLRGEVTRMVGELRLSIFDLRAHVSRAAGLGTALSDYLQQVGASSPFAIHLELDETPRRLPVATESELLRIAQEAITNARKHARATHLWVTCRVDPPRAILRVADDGRGLSGARIDSFGLQIMRERAERIGGQLDVRGRPGGGTIAEVVLGGPARPSDAPAGTSDRIEEGQRC
ncbi:MAG: sensor histidine kinase [Actinomycetes bacterium]